MVEKKEAVVHLFWKDSKELNYSTDPSNAPQKLSANENTDYTAVSVIRGMIQIEYGIHAGGVRIAESEAVPYTSDKALRYKKLIEKVRELSPDKNEIIVLVC